MKKKTRNKRNSFISTKVVGVRADLQFWDMCDKQAKKENVTRNNLIVSVMLDYCSRENNGK